MRNASFFIKAKFGCPKCASRFIFPIFSNFFKCKINAILAELELRAPSGFLPGARSSSSAISFLHSQQGNAALYTLVIIPLVVSFSVLAVDVSRFQTERDFIQREADRISILAAQVLPDTNAAEQVVLQSVASQNSQSLQFRTSAVSITTNEVTLTLEAEVNASFDFFLRKNQNATKFVIQETSSAKLLPIDTMLVFPDDVTLRPRPGETWGEASLWPASNYFNFVSPPIVTGTTATENSWTNWWTEWNNQTFRRWLTESCYNSIYSGLKYSAIALVDVLGTTNGNRLGILATPGDNPALGYSRLLSLSYSAPNQPIQFPGYFEPASYVSDEACVIFADEKESSDETYRINQPPYWSSQAPCSELIENSRWGSRYFPSGMLSRCFLENEFRARDAIYYRVARNTVHAADSANVLSALNEAYVQLTKLTALDITLGKQQRGNLADSAKKQIVIITDSLPSSNSAEMQTLRDRLVAAKIIFQVIFYNHQGLSDTERTNLENVASGYRVIQNWPGLKVYSADSSDVLMNEVNPNVLMVNREIILSK